MSNAYNVTYPPVVSNATQFNGSDNNHGTQSRFECQSAYNVAYPPVVNNATHFNGSGDVTQSHSVDNVTALMANILDRLTTKEQLPNMTPSTFEGDMLSYPSWICMFDSFIEKNCTSLSQRFYYLDKCTGGEAHRCIQGYLSLQTEEAYRKAKATLQRRYGDRYLLAKEVKKKLRDWPTVKGGDGRALRELSDYLLHCATLMRASDYLQLDSEDHISAILEKLPKYVIQRWSRVVDSWINDPSLLRYPSFECFCDLLEKEARIACNSAATATVTGRQFTQRTASSQHSGKTSRTLSTRKSDESQDNATSKTPQDSSPAKASKTMTCFFCSQPHRLEDCTEFQKKTLEERKDFIKKKGICYGCINGKHLSKDCRNRRKCATCKGSHPTVLHDNDFKKETKVLHTRGSIAAIKFNSLILPVNIWSEGTESIRTFALLDEQSDSTFISEKTQRQLGIEGRPAKIRLETMAGQQMVDTQSIRGLYISGVSQSDNSTIRLPTGYVRNMPNDKNMIPIAETARRWPHLRKIAEYLPESVDEDIGLLIGLDCPRAIRPLEVIPGKEGQPWAVRTSIGWGVVGAVSHPDSMVSVCPSDPPCKVAFKTRASEVSPVKVHRMFDRDFNDTSSEDRRSVEDTVFINKLTEGSQQDSSGHFTLPLPLKKEVKLPNNRQVAVKRLQGLQRRLAMDNKYRLDYTTFMNKTIQSGFAEVVPEEEKAKHDGKTWFIPHHGVYHPHKKKMRVVFDCSAEHDGMSLNKCLLQGPNLTNNLVGVLLRFRKQRIALSCDIEAMFHQVFVKEEDRSLLQFLWWKDGNIDIEPTEYRMTVHLFGATSSPGCANFALRKTADIYGQELGYARAADFMKSDFYVDDGLTSVATKEEAIQLILTSHELCKKGGFNLHKYICNNKEVLSAVPQELRSESTQSLEVKEQDVVERTLGVEWDIASDTLRFKIQDNRKPVTRRGILSTIGSIYDPLGLLAPFLLKGKRILQDLIRDGKAWDDPVPEDIARRWSKWKEQLTEFSDFSVPRCYKKEGLEEVRTELHHFSDASYDGYGQCSYIRQVDKQGNVSTSLLMAKARVPPSKPITVPRMELTAAVVSVKIGHLLHKELRLENAEQYFWTDSKVVLGYINNEARKFNIFVANRIQQIHNYSKALEWNYVPSGDNPADLASRGMNAAEIKTSSMWWDGPVFLSSNTELPVAQIDITLPADDPEVKKIVLKTLAHSYPGLVERLTIFSSWTRARKAVASCRRYLQILKDRVNKDKTAAPDRSTGNNSHSVEELQKAEKVILLAVQTEAYLEEFNVLKALQGPTPNRQEEKERNRYLKTSSLLYRLDPYIDEDGLMRVGGRIRRAEIPRDMAHPVILPRTGHITDLIVDHFHKKTYHAGKGTTQAEIRASGFWILQGGRAISSHLSKCVSCKRMYGKTQTQKMADLPEDRVREAPPFTYSATDYFGPFYVREKRSDKKRWGVIFCCMASRAVHMEVANSLTTDSFLNAFRRFTARRGVVRQLRSDQGTNLVGAKSELNAALAEMDTDRIKSTLLKHSCDYLTFKMNYPHSSHMGGSWERLIRSVRRVLTAMLNQHSDRLDDELLHTFLVEAECIVNSRPVSHLSADSTLEPLTPSQILTLKSEVVPSPPGVFLREDLYCRKRWRAVQYLAQQFWNRWKTEYVTMLQERQKWNKTEPNLEVGDVVLVKEEDTARNHWPMARVEEVSVSGDGLVRKVELRTKNGRLSRPIHKLVFLCRPGTPVGEP